LRLQPSLLALKPGTRIVAYSFGIGEWQPDDQIDSFGDGSAFLFVVPANVGGRWTFRSASGDSFVVELEQSYQHLRGTVRGAAATGKLVGDRLEITLSEARGPVLITGTVHPERIIAALARDGSTTEYVGTRD